MKYIALFLIFFGFSYVKSQDNITDSIEIKKKDTLNFKYNFKIGDVITYKLTSYDSIMMDIEKPLIKNREEIIEIRCDSILKNGNFILKYRVTSAKSIESYDGENDIVQTSHPFVNKVIRFEIDSLGKRIQTIFIDKNDAVISPGGAFQPNLIFFLGSSTKAINESWIEESKDTLAENSNPSSIIDQMTLYRLKGIIDTLGEKTTRIDIMRSSKGYFKYIDGKDFINLTNNINHWGVLDISNNLQLPLNYFATSEQKLKVSLGNGETPRVGKHYTSLSYRLISLKNEPITNNQKNKSGKILKKDKNKK